MSRKLTFVKLFCHPTVFSCVNIISSFCKNKNHCVTLIQFILSSYGHNKRETVCKFNFFLYLVCWVVS